jgi:hypothetical protein
MHWIGDDRVLYELAIGGSREPIALTDGAERKAFFPSLVGGGFAWTSPHKTRFIKIVPPDPAAGGQEGAVRMPAAAPEGGQDGVSRSLWPQEKHPYLRS